MQWGQTPTSVPRLLNSCSSSSGNFKQKLTSHEVLGPASKKVYSDTTVSRIYSVYAIAMLPGQTVPLHLDVPEFHGIERSSCPNWLLVAFHANFQINNKVKLIHVGGSPLFRDFLPLESKKRDLSVLPSDQTCRRPCCLPPRPGKPPSP